MRIVVVVNNYNYATYLDQALASLERQSKRPNMVIVVDDGSQDNSIEIIEKHLSRDLQGVLVKKCNGGQLSCFNKSIEYIWDDDIVYFLDADDFYPFDYIESIFVEVDDFHDFYFSSVVRFKDGEKPISSSRISSEPSVSIPMSSSLTRRYRSWIGSPTSAIVIKGWALKAILPYSDERSFITRADDVLVFSSSILGHRKKYLPGLAIGYRVHCANNFFGRKFNPDPAREFALERLFFSMSAKADLPQLSTASSAYLEAKLIPKKYRKNFFIPGISYIGFHRNIERVKRIAGF